MNVKEALMFMELLNQFGRGKFTLRDANGTEMDFCLEDDFVLVRPVAEQELAKIGEIAGRG